MSIDNVTMKTLC